MSGSDQVSIIIPNLHSPVIGEVLDALRSQGRGVDWVEVLVVGLDGHGQVQEDDLVRFISTGEAVVPAQARNLGASCAQGKWLIFLDADCVPQPGWLNAMLDAATRWTDAGAISGAMLPDGDTLAICCGQVAGFHEHLSLHRPGRRRLLASFSLLTTRSIWERVGGFNPEYRTGEDVDFSVRLDRGGWSLYLEPRAQVFHRPRRGSWFALWRHALRSGRLSIQVRRWHADWFKMPRWTIYPWAWRLLSPSIAIVRTMQIYASTPGLWKYGYCAPWVILSKVAWCWGAAAGLAQITSRPSCQEGT